MYNVYFSTAVDSDTLRKECEVRLEPYIYIIATPRKGIMGINTREIVAGKKWEYSYVDKGY